MRLTIKITKEVLKKTKMCGIDNPVIATNCAITFAVREIFPTASVSPWWITVGNPDLPLWGRISLPDDAQEFITIFDATPPEERVLMPELSFQIDVPDSVIESIGIEESKEIISRSSTLELVEG